MNDETNNSAETSQDAATSAPSTVELAAGHEANAQAIAATQAQVDAHETVLGRLIDQVETIAQKGLRVAETGAFGATVATGAELTQEIVDFLHRLFPGHNAPGTPTAPPTP